MKGGFLMKKIYIVLIVLIVLFFASNNNNKQLIIPKESIRFRVIANSDTKKDQENKKIIAKSLENNVTTLLKEVNTLEESRLTLKNNIDKFESNINKTLIENNIEEEYTINYGKNYFPEKEYKGVIYPAGDYESLVVTLGDGLGENFWCVLFPPLCLLEAEEDNSSDVEYTSFVKEVIDKYF